MDGHAPDVAVEAPERRRRDPRRARQEAPAAVGRPGAGRPTLPVQSPRHPQGAEHPVAPGQEVCGAAARHRAESV